MASPGLSLAFVGYVSVYGIATLGCGIAAVRAYRIEDADTRRGLVGLLVASGGWALFELGFLVAPTPALAYSLYTGSLVVGLVTVGAWLYFCSAYTGRELHRDTVLRRAAVAVYLVVVGLKLTNPVHGLYFATEFVTTPFPHLTIHHRYLHWIVAGVSYALAAVGFFMLYEVFMEAGYDTRLVSAVVGVTALPVAFDVVGFTSHVLLDINYEPLGVAVFAAGVLYAFDERFFAVQLTRGVSDPIVYLDADGRVREHNERASDLLPALQGATGTPLADTVPEVAACLDADRQILERNRNGETRYYLVSDTSFTLGQTDIGRMVVLADVTDTERQRRELDRHDDQLEGFAAAIRHELLNTLQIVDARVKIAGAALDRGDVARANESLDTATRTTDRMVDIVDDLADLARYGQTPERVEPVEIGEVAESAHDATGADGPVLSVGADGEIMANPPRLRDLFENAFAFAAHNGASEVTVALSEDGFTITDDGDSVGQFDADDVFEYGKSAPDPEAGLSLPNLRMLARTHGWEARVDDDYHDGVRIVVSGVIGVADRTAE